jgi:ferredoxin-NADP reductase
MAEKRTGTISTWTELTPRLAVFRLSPEAGAAFPDYKAGQYIALIRQNCRLTVRSSKPGGSGYEPAFNPDGTPRMGPVGHSYSIASAPFETKATGDLELYVALEQTGDGTTGRFTESLFRAAEHKGDTLTYYERIVGDFILEKRAAEARNVVLVGTGTGVAPFVSMAKQLAHEAKAGQGSSTRYTIIHANRTVAELGYDAELRDLAAAGIPGFDFQYVRAISRPTPDDAADGTLCLGRANNLLRLLLGAPTREEELISITRDGGGDVTAAERAFSTCTLPKLGRDVDAAALRARMPAGATTVLTCGNPGLMDDIGRMCSRADFKFEMEEW